VTEQGPATRSCDWVFSNQESCLMGYLLLSLHIIRDEINHMTSILWDFKHVTGFIRRGTLHSLSATSAGRPPAVGYPRLLIQRNRSCHPPPAGRLCQPQPEGTPYHTNNSRHLNQRRCLWNVVPLYPQIYIHTHTLQSLVQCWGRIKQLPLIQSSASETQHNTMRHTHLTVGRSQVHTLFMWRHSSS
jgi:hypothetical protein